MYLTHRFFHFALIFLLFFSWHFPSQIAFASDDEEPVSDEEEDTPTRLLPFVKGAGYKLIQGFNGKFSHSECMAYALDFTMPVGTKIASAAPGIVTDIKEDSDEGGADESFKGKGNYIQIDEGGGEFGYYVHLCQNCVDVEVGDKVKQGQVIGRSGNTGYTTTPHLHYAVYEWDGNCSTSFGFADVEDEDGIPVEGKTYVSGNDGQSAPEYEPSIIETESFSVNGVTLSTDIPLILSKAQTYTVSGEASNGEPKVVLFLLKDGTVVDKNFISAGEDGTFEFEYSPPEALANGSYGLALDTTKDGGYYSEFSRRIFITD